MAARNRSTAELSRSRPRGMVRYRFREDQDVVRSGGASRSSFRDRGREQHRMTFRIGIISDTHGLLRPEAESGLAGVNLGAQRGAIVYMTSGHIDWITAEGRADGAPA